MQASSFALLQVAGIPGECAEPAFPDWIELTSLGLAGTLHSGSPGMFTAYKRIDKSNNAGEDGDGDGLTDYQEFELGTNPKAKSPRFAAVISPAPDDPESIDISWEAVPGISYVVEWSPDLVQSFSPLWVRPDPRFPDPESASAEVKRWVDHHVAIGTGAISSGFIVLQRCEPGQEWTRSDSRITGEIPSTANEEVVRVLTNESWLQSAPSDADLLQRRYLVPDGIQAEIKSSLGDHGWQDRTIRLISPGKLVYDGQIDENLMRLLELCRKDRSPADMVAELRAQDT